MDSTPSQKIDVDLLHLKDTRDGISRDADDALKPGISDANGRIVGGSTFGQASPSGEVDASKLAMANALTTFLDNCRTHVDRTQQIIAFLDMVMARYETADELAKLDIDTVLRMLAEATPPEPLTAVETRGHFA